MITIIAYLILNTSVSLHDERSIVINEARDMVQSGELQSVSVKFKRLHPKRLKRILKANRCTCGRGYCNALNKKNVLTLFMDAPVDFDGPFPVALWNYSCKRPSIDAFLDRTTSGLLRDEITLFLERCGR